MYSSYEFTRLMYSSNKFGIMVQQYKSYLEHHEEILLKLDVAMKKNKDLEHFLDEFEARKSCYLPLNTFFMKPVQRLLHYKLILESKWI